MNYTKPKFIQLIHIAKNKLGMDEESYRALLFRLTGKQSCKAMKIAELQTVLYEMEQKGFTHAAKPYTTKGKKSPASDAAKVKSRIALKIRAVWITMGKQGFIRDASEDNLNYYMRKFFNKPEQGIWYLNVVALPTHEASHFLEILKKWHQRGMIDALTERGVQINKNISYDACVTRFEQIIFQA